MSPKHVSEPPAAKFGRAFRTARLAKGLSQESFDGVSSRTYVSMLERSVGQPTLVKVDALSAVLELHPLTVLALSYAADPTSAAVNAILAQVRSEVELMNATAFAGEQRIHRSKG